MGKTRVSARVGWEGEMDGLFEQPDRSEKFADCSLHPQLDLRALKRSRGLKREANLIGRRTRKRCGDNPARFRNSDDVDSHIKMRQTLKTCEPVACEFLRRLFVAEEPLEIGGGKLNKGLKEVSLLAVVPHCVPQPLEDFVTFPPVGEVVEVDPIQVILCLLPFFRWKG